MKTKTSVVLLATHLMNDFIISQYNAIKSGIDDDTDLIVLLEDKEQNVSLVPADIKYYLFSVDSLKKLGYIPIEKTITPGSNHFPVLQFYREYPNYDYYWNIEYDVYFHGNWRVFFREFETSKADFISSHIETYNIRPDWGWWKSLSFRTVSIDEPNWVRSFNPIYRLSNDALKYLEAKFCEGNSGHHEAILATLLSNVGFTLLELGGCGVFTPESLENRFYQSYRGIDDFYRHSTMRYRPIFSKEYLDKIVEDNKIYHPLKDTKEAAEFNKELNSLKDDNYDKRIIKLLTKAAVTGCESILNVGYNSGDVISNLPLKVKVNFDLEKPLVAAGVENITGDFLTYAPEELFDIVCCLQTLEHVPNVTEFADRLFAMTKKYVFISVPYKWPAGLCAEHVHDPVDEVKLAKWTKRQPIFREIIEDQMLSRMICIYRIK